jgi:hypothetical protein
MRREKVQQLSPSRHRCGTQRPKPLNRSFQLLPVKALQYFKHSIILRDDKEEILGGEGASPRKHIASLTMSSTKVGCDVSSRRLPDMSGTYTVVVFTATNFTSEYCSAMKRNGLHGPHQPGNASTTAPQTIRKNHTVLVIVQEN